MYFDKIILDTYKINLLTLVLNISIYLFTSLEIKSWSPHSSFAQHHLIQLTFTVYIASLSTLNFCPFSLKSFSSSSLTSSTLPSLHTSSSSGLSGSYTDTWPGGCSQQSQQQGNTESWIKKITVKIIPEVKMGVQTERVWNLLLKKLISL